MSKHTCVFRYDVAHQCKWWCACCLCLTSESTHLWDMLLHLWQVTSATACRLTCETHLWDTCRHTCHVDSLVRHAVALVSHMHVRLTTPCRSTCVCCDMMLHFQVMLRMRLVFHKWVKMPLHMRVGLTTSCRSTRVCFDMLLLIQVVLHMRVDMMSHMWGDVGV